MPRSYPKTDSEFKYFQEQVKPTKLGERYLSQWSELLATIQQLTTPGLPTTVGTARDRLCRLYVLQSNSCTRTLRELEERYGWPAP